MTTISIMFAIGAVFVTSFAMPGDVFPAEQARDIARLEMTTDAMKASAPNIVRARRLAKDHTWRQCQARRVFVEGVAIVDCFRWWVFSCRMSSPLAKNVASCEARYTMVWHRPSGDLFREYEATLFYKHDGEQWHRLGPTTWIYYPWGPLRAE